MDGRVMGDTQLASRKQRTTKSEKVEHEGDVRQPTKR